MSDSSDSEPPKTTNSYDESKRAWWSPCERFNESRSSSNDWTTNNTRCKLRHIKFNQCGRCPLCRCIRKAIPLLFDSANEWGKRFFDDDTQFDWGYHSQFGAAYVIPKDAVYYSNPIPIDWIERSDRVEIYPPDSRPRFWKGSPILLRDVPLSGGSDASFKFITSCLDQCLEFHPLCRSTELFMPKRVLRIGLDVKDIRLFEPEEEGCHDIKYAALSHCWGKSLPIRTIRSTLDERKRGIEWSALPATFRDAVTVCSRLHIEYLWIDALCIIQDDDHDWVVESAKMAQVYRNAHVSILGARSGSCHEQFLTLNKQHMVAVRSRAADGSLSKTHLRLGIRSGLHFSESTASYGRLIAGAGLANAINDPLDERGWTLQERQLSTRKVIYSSGEVQWECKTMTACECRIDTRKPKGSDDNKEPHPTHQRWMETVHALTRRQFTYEEDKLPSLSGMCADIRQCSNSRYLAGLWMSSLQEQLAWIPIARPYKPFPAPYIAPTFSWASSSSEVFWREEGTQLTMVVDAVCTPSTIDPFGRVRDGFVKLAGSLHDAYISFHSDDVPFQLSPADQESFKSNSISFCPDGPLIPTDQDLKERTVVRSTEQEQQAFEWAPVKILLMSYDNRRGDSRSYTALVLGMSQRRPGCYERLGIALDMKLKNDSFSDRQRVERDKKVVTIV